MNTNPFRKVAMLAGYLKFYWRGEYLMAMIGCLCPLPQERRKETEKVIQVKHNGGYGRWGMPQWHFLSQMSSKSWRDVGVTAVSSPLHTPVVVDLSFLISRTTWLGPSKDLSIPVCLSLWFWNKTIWQYYLSEATLICHHMALVC